MKRFLACSGGGDRGIVLLGMLEELHKLKGKEAVRWDEMAGISVGGFMVAYLSQTTPETFPIKVSQLKTCLLKDGFEIKDPWVWGGQVINFMNAFMNHNSIYSNQKMKDLLDTWFNEKESHIPFHVGAYNKTLSQYETMSSTDKSINIKTACMASAAVPVVLPEVKIGKYNYQDGGMRHIIPVEEIKSWLNRTCGKRHVDVLVCFPIHKPNLFTEMTTPVFNYPLLDEATRMVSDLMLEQLQNDVVEISKICNIDVESIKKSSCGVFEMGDVTLQIMSPSEGHYTSMMRMTQKSNMELFKSGVSVVKDFIQHQLKM